MSQLAAGRIRHTVVFTPTHTEGSSEEADFLEAAARLAAIPGVEAFEILRETSPKNGYRFGISMEFAGPAASSSTSTRSFSECTATAMRPPSERVRRT